MANTFKNSTFRSPGTFGNITIGILGFLVITAALNIAVSIFMVASPASTIELSTGESIETSWIMVGLLALGELALRALCAIFFLMWLYRSFNNLSVLGARNLEFSPGWSIGWWFVPFANFVMPFKVVRELYSESDPAKRDRSSLSERQPVTNEIIGFWWGTLLAFGIALRVSDGMAGGDNSDPSKYFPVVYMVGHILMLASAISALVIVKNINKWQEEIIVRKVGAEGFAPPPPPTFGSIEESSAEPSQPE